MCKLPVLSWFAQIQCKVRFGLATGFCLLAFQAIAIAQGARAAQSDAKAAPISSWTQEVNLGSSTVEVTGPWKFRRGDNMDWIRPDFNDSGWTSMDLTPPPGSYDPFLGTSGFMPGWTVLGNPGYSGYAWYRLKVDVKIEPGPAKNALEIKMPEDVDDAYEVYVNGKRIGEFGRFTKHGVISYLSLPRSFAIPRDIQGGTMTIAIRVWMDPATPLTNPDTGGLHGPPVLGQAEAVEGMLRLDWDAVNHSMISRIFEVAVLLLSIAVAGVLFWLDRKEKAYLWLGLSCLGVLLQTIMSLIGNYTTWIPGAPHLLLTDAIIRPLSIGLWVIFWAHWFRLGKMARLHKMVWGMALLLALDVAMLRAPLYGHVIPVRAILLLGPLMVFLKLLLGSLLVWVTCVSRSGFGGHIALRAGVAGTSRTTHVLPVRICGGYRSDRGGGFIEHHYRSVDAAFPRVAAPAATMAGGD
jgi:hypothetical protein